MQRYQTVFFDLDHTLWDTSANARECLEDIYVKYKISERYSSFHEFYTIYTANNERLWGLYSRHEITKEQLVEERFSVLFDNYEEFTPVIIRMMDDEYINNIQFKSRTIEGTFDLLDYLKPRYDLHIISNGFTELQYNKMNSAGLSPYFDKVILSDVVGVNKPHPEIFEYALREAGATKENAIMIGDNLFADIEGAARSGISQIWFNNESEQCNSVKPTHVVKKLAEIMDIL